MRRQRWPILIGYLIAVALSVYAVDRAERGERYSPYYALKTQDVIGSTEKALLTNGSLHQMLMAIQFSGPPTADSTEQIRKGYHLPYEVLDGDPGSILILGAGTGNDVAVALEEGATKVDAVEIDPVILEYGEDFHPNQPYSDERVTSFVTDARSFLNDSDESYDLVVFGTLDSQTKLSALSSVRLDNFVYTREGLEAAAGRLSPGGGLVLYFMVGEEFIAEHIVAMLTIVFGQPPTVLKGGWNMFNHIFLAGPAFAEARPGVDGASLDAAFMAQIPVPTDDWPYLYLPNRGLTPFYWSLLLSLGGLAVLAVLLSSPEMRAVVRERRGGDWEMFLYGFGFLLVEARLVNAINLAWGATWLTSAVVFGSVLAALLIVTLLMELLPIPWRVAAIGLVVSLGLTYLLPVSALVAPHGVTRLILSAIYVGAPVVFAGACFAIRFRTRPNSSVAFGWNLLGAVLGGLLEFLAMDFGLRAMVLLALAAYGVAILLGERSGAGVPDGVADTEPQPA